MVKSVYHQNRSLFSCSGNEESSIPKKIETDSKQREISKINAGSSHFSTCEPKEKPTSF